MPDSTDFEAEFRKFLDEVDPIDFSNYAEFSHFVTRHAAEAERSFHAAEDTVETLAYLRGADGETIRIYPEDETFNELFLRIREAAQKFGSTMFFMSLVLRAANKALDIDATDSNALAEAFQRGDLTMHYGFYAEVKTRGVRKRVSGLWPINDDGTLGELVTGSPTVAPLFHKVLP